MIFKSNSISVYIFGTKIIGIDIMANDAWKKLIEVWNSYFNKLQ